MSLPYPFTQIIQNYTIGNARSFVLGGGLAYAVSNGYWHHTPLILLNPVAYTGYQLFVSQGLVMDWCKQTYGSLTQSHVR
jgi:hypothetical protein